MHGVVFAHLVQSLKSSFGVKGECEKCATEKLEELKDAMVKLVRGE